MALSEYMEELIKNYLVEVELTIPEFGIITISPEKAAEIAAGLNEVLTPEFDAMVREAQRAGYTSAENRYKPDPFNIQSKPGDNIDPRHPNEPEDNSGIPLL